MMEFQDGSRLIATDDIHNLIFLELLFHSLNNLQHQLNLFGSVHFRLRMVTVVAIVAIFFRVILTKVMQKMFSAAIGRFGV